MPACVCAACVLVPVQELATGQQGARRAEARPTLVHRPAPLFWPRGLGGCLRHSQLTDLSVVSFLLGPFVGNRLSASFTLSLSVSGDLNVTSCMTPKVRSLDDEGGD